MKVHNKSNYVERRVKEYPPLEEQMDALWKGGKEAEAMRNQIKGIKSKYPKNT